MSSFKLEGMTTHARVKTIKEHLRNSSQYAFHECQGQAEDSEAYHDPPKKILRTEREALYDLRATGGSVHLSKFVSAMVGLGRDINRHRGRLFSLRPKIDGEAIPRLEEFFSGMVKLAHDIENNTCYYHVGDGVIVRVRGTTTKMYISDTEDFHKYAKPGFFVENYYLPGRTSSTWDVLTLNILTNEDDIGRRDEMKFHFELESHEEAIALMMGRFNEGLRKVLVRSVLFGEAVSQLIAGAWNSSGALVNASNNAYVTLPTESVIMALLMQQFGATVDDNAREEFDIFNFFRISAPNEAGILAHYDWLVNAKLCVPSSAPKNTMVGAKSLKAIVDAASKSVFIKDQKLYRYGNRRFITAAVIVLVLIAVGSYASFGQGVQPAEAVEKALSLVLFGVVLAVLTILSAKRDEDLVSDIFKRRVQLKSSRRLSDTDFQDFLTLLQMDTRAHECLSHNRCAWVKGEKTGKVHLHRLVHLGELKWKELLIRANGDILFGDRGFDDKLRRARKVRMAPNGLLLVEEREEKAYGYIIEAGRTEVFLE